MIVGLRKSVWDGASVRDRTIFVHAIHHGYLNQPAIFETGTGQQWCVFAHWDFTLKGLAELGTVAKGIASNTTYELPMKDGEVDLEQLHIDVSAWVASRVVWPVDLTDEDDVYAAVLAAQDAPAALRASGGIPSGLTPVSDGV